jgi:hypothetical protein
LRPASEELALERPAALRYRMPRGIGDFAQSRRIDRGGSIPPDRGRLMTIF